MKRIPFSQVIKSASIDLRMEYSRLYSMFFIQKFQDGRATISIQNFCSVNFMNLPFRGTCISLDDFNKTFGYSYERNFVNIDIDFLVRFCEYSYNLVLFCQPYAHAVFMMNMSQAIQTYMQQVNKVIEIIGYMSNVQENGVVDFVPKDQAAISTAEIVDPSLSYKIIEYNHHSMKGDIRRKHDVILSLADQLEPQRARLKQINSTMETDLFYLFNNLNLRHNNADPNGKNYVPFIASMNEEEIERWYDDTYQMCLLAFLELDQLDRKVRVAQLKADIQNHAK